MDINQAVAAVLSAHMERERWTKAEVARRVGVSYPTILNKLSGSVSITVHDLMEISRVIDIDPASVFRKARQLALECELLCEVQKQGPR